MNTGSKNNIPFFQEILTKFHINHYPIHDMDTEKLANGNNSPAWTLNQKIWGKIEEANNLQDGLARRYVHNKNFEDAHKEQYKIVGNDIEGNKDKPLRAYLFALSINDDNKSSFDCFKWLCDIIGKQEILHDMNYIAKQ